MHFLPNLDHNVSFFPNTYQNWPWRTYACTCRCISEENMALVHQHLLILYHIQDTFQKLFPHSNTKHSWKAHKHRAWNISKPKNIFSFGFQSCSMESYLTSSFFPIFELFFPPFSLVFYFLEWFSIFPFAYISQPFFLIGF